MKFSSCSEPRVMHIKNDRNRSGGGVDARRGDRAEKIAEESSDETADVIALRAENAALRDELHTLRLELQARYARDMVARYGRVT